MPAQRDEPSALRGGPSQEKIKKVISQIGSMEKLSPIKARLPESIGYEKIKLVNSSSNLKSLKSVILGSIINLG